MLSDLPADLYGRSCSELSDATIGQHLRHILEFYVCLKDGYEKSIVNYDNRSRDMSLEASPKVAMAKIDELIGFISSMDLERDVKLEGNWSNSTEISTVVPSNYKRELAYNIEHSIHHQALIKVGLIVFGKCQLVSNHFGVAPATIRYRSN